MVRYLLCAAATVALMIGLPGAAAAQEPQRGPLVFLSAAQDAHYYGTVPVDGTNGASWIWQFLRTPQAVGDKTYDALVTPYEVNCAANRLRSGARVIFNDGVRVGQDSRREDWRDIEAGSVGEMLAQTLCRPLTDPAWRQTEADDVAAQRLAEGIWRTQSGQ